LSRSYGGLFGGEIGRDGDLEVAVDVTVVDVDGVRSGDVRLDVGVDARPVGDSKVDRVEQVGVVTSGTVQLTTSSPHTPDTRTQLGSESTIHTARYDSDVS